MMDQAADADYIGTCTTMCPSDEIKLRRDKRLIHRLECTDRPPSRGRGRGRGRQNTRFPDENRMVKEYTRPAAGKVDPKPHHLRTPDTLEKTVKYLIHQVVPRKDVPWYVVYEFVFDRLRAVRQEMVIQRIGGMTAIHILEQTTRFLIFSNYKLCEEDFANFDPKINETHLQECLKWLMCLYEDDQPYVCHMEEFISLYILFNLGSFEALQLALERKSQLGKCDILQRALHINLAWIKKNYTRVFRIAQTLPCIQKCAFHRNIGKIQREALGIMSSGYNSKVLKYPLSDISQLLCIENSQETEDLCRLHGVDVEQGQAKFSRLSFISDSKIRTKRYRFIDTEFESQPAAELISSSCQCEGS